MNAARIYNKFVDNALIPVVMLVIVGGALCDNVIGMFVEEEDGHEGEE